MSAEKGRKTLNQLWDAYIPASIPRWPAEFVTEADRMAVYCFGKSGGEECPLIYFDFPSGRRVCSECLCMGAREGEHSSPSLAHCLTPIGGTCTACAAGDASADNLWESVPVGGVPFVVEKQKKSDKYIALGAVIVGIFCVQHNSVAVERGQHPEKGQRMGWSMEKHYRMYPYPKYRDGAVEYGGDVCAMMKTIRQTFDPMYVREQKIKLAAKQRNFDLVGDLGGNVEMWKRSIEDADKFDATQIAQAWWQ